MNERVAVSKPLPDLFAEMLARHSYADVLAGLLSALSWKAAWARSSGDEREVQLWRERAASIAWLEYSARRQDGTQKP